MKTSESTQALLNRIVKGIEDTAKARGITPQEVTSIQFFEHVPGVTPWDFRKFQGFAAIKKTYFPIDNKDLAVIRREKEIVKYVRTLENKASGQLVLEQELRKIVQESLQNLPIETIKLEKPKIIEGTGLTIELMLSDLHYGRKSKAFNIKVARERMQRLTTVFLQELDRKKKEGYKVERIIVALIGDIIENFSFHGLESAAASEFGNSRQVQEAITSLYYDTIMPIAKLGYDVFIPCVTGNHDRADVNKTMNNPGENHLTWIVYTALEEYCKIAGLKNVKFEIAKGSYIIHKIYNNNCLYEHGDNCKSNVKRSFETLMSNRGIQNNVTIDFGRFGHFHDYACYDRGRIIVNESLAGQDSYSEVSGYNSKAGQTINYYVNTKKRANSFFYSFPVDLT